MSRPRSLVLFLGLCLLLQGCNKPPRVPKCFADQPAGPTSTSSAHRSAAARNPDLPYVPGQLLVRYQSTSSDLSTNATAGYALTAQSVRQNHGLTVLREGNANAPDLVTVADVEQAAAELQRDPRVAYAHPNYYLEPLLTPNDTLFNQQWNLSNFGLPEAWEAETGENADGQNVVLAVIDSGVDTDHEDLAGKILPGCDVFNQDNDPNPGPPTFGDFTEHGTHVAGIAAAVGNNVRGIAGVAFGTNVRVLPIKVFDQDGVTGTTDNLLRAVLWAAGIAQANIEDNPNPADIINMSVGAGTNTIPAVDDATSQAFNRGVVLFASAGNNGVTGVQSPANAPDVIAVGSVNNNSQRSSFSATGSELDLMAPGGSGPASCGSVLSTFPSDEYACLQGTSMASPFAAGVAALLLSQDPTLTPTQIKTQLTSTALFDAGFMNANEYGSGIVCADAALGLGTQCGN